MIVGDLLTEGHDDVISTAQNPPQWAGKLDGVDWIFDVFHSLDLEIIS